MVVLPISDQIYSTEIRPRRERWLSGKKKLLQVQIKSTEKKWKEIMTEIK